MTSAPSASVVDRLEQRKTFISVRRNNSPLGQLSLPYVAAPKKLLSAIGQTAIDEILRQYLEERRQSGSDANFQWYVRSV